MSQRTPPHAQAEPRRLAPGPRLAGETGREFLLEQAQIDTGGAGHRRREGSVSRSAQRGDLGQELVPVDRLHDEVARALPHAPDLVGFLALRRAQDDRNVASCRRRG